MKRRTFTQSQIRYLRDRAEEQYENMHGSRSYRNVEFLLYIAVVVLVALAVRSFIAEPILVDGDSMVPTLLHRQEMLVEKMTYWVRDPARGDIVICFYPGYTSCVKRVIGLPGETVEVKDGAIYIDGVPLDESPYWSGVIVGDSAPVTVGKREVYVVGDNRSSSKDSRNPSVGPIPYAKVVGRVVAVVYPFNAFETFSGVTYPWVNRENDAAPKGARTYRNARRIGWLSALVTLAVLCVAFFVWLFPTRIVDEHSARAHERRGRSLRPVFKVLTRAGAQGYRALPHRRGALHQAYRRHAGRDGGTCGRACVHQQHSLTRQLRRQLCRRHGACRSARRLRLSARGQPRGDV
ncbi:MAG: signal peptidase I [Eubacteriales bacterium]